MCHQAVTTLNDGGLFYCLGKVNNALLVDLYLDFVSESIFVNYLLLYTINSNINTANILILNFYPQVLD